MSFANSIRQDDYIHCSRHLRQPSLRDRVRHLTLNGLSWSIGKKATLPGSPRVQFLVFHHVFEDEAADFQDLISRLRQGYQIISYSEAVTRIWNQQIDRPYLAISFDDGLKCCLKAAEILAEAGVSACFFVCPGIVGATDFAKIASFCRQRLAYPPVEFLDWCDIERIVGLYHEIGGHTMNHVRLSRMSLAQAKDEIGDSYRALTSRLGSIAHFAWPYGQFADMHRKAVQSVFDEGYVSCASGVRGSHGREDFSIASRSIDRAHLCLRRDSLVAGWPRGHIRYFLERSARRPLTAAETWPQSLAPFSSDIEETRCTLSSTPYRSGRVAG